MWEIILILGWFFFSWNPIENNRPIPDLWITRVIEEEKTLPPVSTKVWQSVDIDTPKKAADWYTQCRMSVSVAQVFFLCKPNKISSSSWETSKLKIAALGEGRKELFVHLKYPLNEWRPHKFDIEMGSTYRLSNNASIKMLYIFDTLWFIIDFSHTAQFCGNVLSLTDRFHTFFAFPPNFQS